MQDSHTKSEMNGNHIEMYKCERETRWHALAIRARIKQNHVGALSELNSTCFAAMAHFV